MHESTLFITSLTLAMSKVITSLFFSYFFSFLFFFLFYQTLLHFNKIYSCLYFPISSIIHVRIEEKKNKNLKYSSWFFYALRFRYDKIYMFFFRPIIIRQKWQQDHHIKTKFDHLLVKVSWNIYWTSFFFWARSFILKLEFYQQLQQLFQWSIQDVIKTW